MSSELNGFDWAAGLSWATQWAQQGLNCDFLIFLQGFLEGVTEMARAGGPGRFPWGLTDFLCGLSCRPSSLVVLSPLPQAARILAAQFSQSHPWLLLQLHFLEWTASISLVFAPPYKGWRWLLNSALLIGSLLMLPTIQTYYLHTSYNLVTWSHFGRSPSLPLRIVWPIRILSLLGPCRFSGW